MPGEIAEDLQIVCAHSSIVSDCDLWNPGEGFALTEQCGAKPAFAMLRVRRGIRVARLEPVDPRGGQQRQITTDLRAHASVHGQDPTLAMHCVRELVAKRHPARDIGGCDVAIRRFVVHFKVEIVATDVHGARQAQSAGD